MSQQLRRKFTNETYYCEKITTDYQEAEKTKKAAKAAKFKARIIPLKENGHKTYGVFVH